ncbi:hypothetical protein [Halomonas elongata]|uniref:hypothetical protein n=1 Tax=Halomonas elongata TaxID=2746 RepID=UPI001CEC622D|nr:hypothetical protein [Halomonas elongata]MBW5798625.1 hypothetical protein [Halomonas elongata]
MTDANASRYRRPDYRITLGGTGITPRVNGHLIRLTLREQRGLGAAPSWQWPSGLIDKGLFTVDEVQHSGTPHPHPLGGPARQAHPELALPHPGRGRRYHRPASQPGHARREGLLERYQRRRAPEPSSAASNAA